MSDNFYKDNETYSDLIDPQPIFSQDSIKELLYELYIILSNTDVKVLDSSKFNDIEDKLEEFINNFLFEYDLDPKIIFTSVSQNIVCYSSLIGFFHQKGIGCEVDKFKAFEIYSNAVNDKKISQLSSDQKNEVAFRNDDIKRLNAIILQYFYSLFLYKNVIIYREDSYKLHIKKAEKGDPVSQYHVGNCYYYGKNVKKNYSKAIEWYLKSSEGESIQATYHLSRSYLLGHFGHKARAIREHLNYFNKPAGAINK